MALRKKEISALVSTLTLGMDKIDLSKSKIGVIGHKGGVGKSTLAMQIALACGLKIVDLDAYGTLGSRLDNVLSFGEDEEIYLPKNGYVVDFGGYAHQLEDDIIAELDLLIVPFYPDELIVETTYNMLNGFEENDTPILFVANRIKTKDEKLAQSAVELFDSLAESQTTSFATIYASDAIVSATRGDYSVVAKALTGKGLEQSNNITVAMQFLELFKQIQILGEK